MKKFYVVIVILLTISSVQAQYKKASFLNKSGRTYDVSFAGRFLSGGGGTVPGIYYSYGRDKGNRIFHWFDLEVLLPTKFTYNTVDKNNAETVVTVSGKSKLGIVYRYNLAYYLTDAENTESKFKPFVTAGINFLIIGGGANFDYTPTNTEPVKSIIYSPFSYGANAGVGGIYALSEKIGIKVMAGYNLQGQVTGSQYSTTNEPGSVYKVFSNHPYVGVGIRFIMNSDGD